MQQEYKMKIYRGRLQADAGDLYIYVQVALFVYDSELAADSVA